MKMELSRDETVSLWQMLKWYRDRKEERNISDPYVKYCLRVENEVLKYVENLHKSLQPLGRL